MEMTVRICTRYPCVATDTTGKTPFLPISDRDPVSKTTPGLSFYPHRWENPYSRMSLFIVSWAPDSTYS